MPSEMGIGFTDCGCVGGSDASKYGRKIMLKWREDLYRRLEVLENELVDSFCLVVVVFWEGMVLQTSSVCFAAILRGVGAESYTSSCA